MWLKRLRIVSSSLFFLLVLGIFLFSIEKTEILFRIILYPQFIPSLVNFLLSAGGLAASGFIAILLLTLLFGRVYCGWICPLGILQDIFIFVSSKLRKKRRFSFSKPYPVLNLAILSIATSIMILGSMSLVNLFEPYSMFGRFVTYFVKTPITAFNNLVSYLLAKTGYYGIAPSGYPELSVPLLAVTAVSILVILVLAIVKGRLYCTALCPVGTILGFVSRLSIFKVRIKESDCSECKKCERVCSASCIDSENKTVDSSRCIACFDCIAVCSNNAVVFSPAFGGSVKKTDVDLSKRRFLAGSLAGAGLIIGASVPLRLTAKSSLADREVFPPTPPGSIGIAHYTSSCTGCNLCVIQCPGNVIQPGFLEYGLRGFMQPRMDYESGYCIYECNTCGNVCPANAIKPLALQAKQRVQIGKVSFIKEKCLVVTDNVNCSACSEHCPTHAVYTVPYGALFLPETNTDICVGCGACEHICPVRPERAIVVAPHENHLTALPPPEIIEKKADAGDSSSKDFPF